MTMDLMAAIAVALLMVAGAVFTFLAALGVLRFPDLLTRMHAASKAGMLGGGLLLLGAGLHSGEWHVLLRALAGMVFLFLSTPVSAHLLAKAALGKYRGR